MLSLMVAGALAGPLPGDPLGLDASGYVVLTQDELTIQTKESFEWQYVVGSDGFPEGSALQIHDPVFHGMRWSKWGDLFTWYDLLNGYSCEAQTDHGSQASWGMISAYATDAAGERLDDVFVGIERSNCDGGFCTKSIHEVAQTNVYMSRGDLSPGDIIHVVHGDVDGCVERCEEAGLTDCSICDRCGFEAPDRSFSSVWWQADECIGDAACSPVAPVAFSVVAQEAASVLVTGPSIITVGDTVALKAALLDAYGNPVEGEPRTLTLGLQADGAKLPISVDEATHQLSVGEDEGWHDFSVTFEEAGVYRLEVNAGGGFSGISNPILVTETPEPYQIYWGDIHVHHGYTWVEEGQRRDFNHDYGRDVVGLDVVSESIKADGIEIDADELWAELQDTCTQYSEDGEYLVLLGFEWIGDDAALAECGDADLCSDGHHNIYYDSCDGPLGSQDPKVTNSVDDPELGLWAWLDRARADYSVDAVSIPHAMRWTEFKFDSFYLTDEEPGYPGTQTLVEVISEWGDGTGDPDDDGSVQQMMTSGHRLGWIGGSDNHDGWFGNPYAKQSLDANSSGGLGAWVAEDLTRADIMDAMKKRRTYASSGPRAILLFTAEEFGEELQQGTELLAEEPTLRWQYYGTAPIQSLKLFRLTVGDDSPEPVEISAVVDPVSPDSAGFREIIANGDWDGESDVLFWVEVLQKDREKVWSSPIWLTADCDRIALGAVDPRGLCSPDTGDSGNSGDSGSSSGDSGANPPGRVRCTCATGTASSAAWLVLAVVAGALGRRRR